MSSRRQSSIPLCGRYRQVSLQFISLVLIIHHFLFRNPSNPEQMYHTYLGPIPDTHASRRDSFISQTQRIPKYYSSYPSSKIPWQSTRPLPDPETDCGVEYINEHGTMRSSVGRRYSDHGDRGVKYDVLDPALRTHEQEIFEGD